MTGPFFAGTVQTHWGGYDPSPPTGRELHALLNGCIEEAVLIDQHGFDGILVAERHGRSECVAPDPTGLLSAIASRTSRAFLGTYIRLLSLHHPVAVAEAFAQLDGLSGGRAVAGVGIGYHAGYFDLFGVDAEQRRRRFNDAIEIIRAAWSGENLDHDWAGRRLRGEVHPRPEGGTIPLWIGAQFPSSIELAGRLGDGWAVAFPFDRSTWDEHRARYLAAARSSDRPAVCVLSRHCWVGESREAAVARYAPLWLEELRYYWRRGQVSHRDFRSMGDFTEAKAAKNLVLGTPEDCAEQIVDYVHNWGIDVMKLTFRLPLGPEPEAVHENIARIGSEVLPLVHAELGIEPEPAPAASLRAVPKAGKDR